MIKFIFADGTETERKFGAHFKGFRNEANTRPVRVDWSTVDWDAANEMEPRQVRYWFYNHFMMVLESGVKIDPLPEELVEILNKCYNDENRKD